MKSTIIKNKVKSNAIPFSALRAGKLYSYRDKDDSPNTGVVLIAKKYGSDDEISVVELQGSDRGNVWASDASVEDFIFSEFNDTLQITNN